MTSDQYREGFRDGMSNQRRQIDSEDFFDRPDCVRGFAAGRESGWRIGDEAMLDYPLSPWHGKVGYVIGADTMHDGQLVIRVEWPDGTELAYVPERLRYVEDEA